ncbi:MAG: zinc metallopeptidase [Thermoguttaceae bacterium]|nr:zinc metallopeptidase [Thermoguttaceae bacterium]MDW8077776.1 zinc metallopeptidase [Thermoguttaceae bacterium]
MIGLFDPLFWMLVGPAVLLGVIAQIWVRFAFARAQRVVAPLSGAETAEAILRAAGIQDVDIRPVEGFLADHYDPQNKVIRLSPEVFASRSVAAMGIAAHEAGHALQHAERYAPLSIRNAAVGIASLGSNSGILLFILGLILSLPVLMWLGLVLFSGVVFFQLVNLPVEFNASARAKALLARMGLVDPRSQRLVNSVLTAAALTYVAATLQAVMTLVYYVMLARGQDREA